TVLLARARVLRKQTPFGYTRGARLLNRKRKIFLTGLVHSGGKSRLETWDVMSVHLYDLVRLAIECMHKVSHPALCPSRRMVFDPFLQARAAVIVHPGLNDLRALVGDQCRRFRARTDDSNMARLLCICFPESSDYQLSVVGQVLRFQSGMDAIPATRFALLTQPAILRVCQQDLAVIRRSKNVYPESHARSGDKRTAVSVRLPVPHGLV